MTPPHVIGIIKSTGWTFELPMFCLWYCTTACSYFAAEALLFKINLLITITYEVGISMWLQHTFTERRNLRGRACLLTCLKLLDFTGKTIGQKYIFPPATLSSNTFFILHTRTTKTMWHLHTWIYTRRKRSDGGQSQAVNSGHL